MVKNSSLLKAYSKAFAVIGFILIASCSKSENSTIASSMQPLSMETKAEVKPFTFPDLDWKQFDSYTEKVAALQVPEDILHSMNSFELAELVYDYPFLVHGLAYNDYLFGVGRVLERFNAYKELLQREDAYPSLLMAFKNRFPVEVGVSELPRKSVVEYSINMRLCAYVLCQDSNVPAKTESDFESLIRIADELQASVEQEKELMGLSIMSVPVMLKDFADSKR